MLMLLFAVTTWAQVVEGQMYRIKNVDQNLYLTIDETQYNRADQGGTYGSVPLITKEVANEDQVWYFEPSGTDNQYYVVSKSGYYLFHHTWNVLAYNTDQTKAIVEFVANGDNYKIKNCNTSQWYKVQQVSGVWHPFCDADESAAASWVLEIVEDSEFELSDDYKALLNGITTAEALQTSVNANIGTIIGKYSQASADALADAIATAKTLTNATTTATDVETLQAVIDGTKMILPTAGKYYQFHSAWQSFEQTVALYSNGTNARWQTLDNDDKRYYWLAEETENGDIVLKNANDEKYLLGNAGTSSNWTISDSKTGAEISVKIIDETDSENIEYAIVGAGRHMHAANSTSWGSVVYEGNIVSWETNAANTCSGWFIKEVELPSFYNITYEFTYNGEVKYTQETKLVAGANLPAVNVKFPYGVSATAPEGIVGNEDETYEIALNIEKALPFESATSVEGITKWYYVQMHMNSAVTSYIQDNNDGIVEWADKDFTASEIDSHLWGFVGDVWNGIKVVNKGTGNAITSTNGAAATGDAANATAFFIDNSQAANPACFCLKYPNNSNYLNAQGSAVASWGDNDNGSSFLLTEYKEFEATVSAVEYATLFLNYNAFIPEGVEVYAVNGTVSNYVTLAEVTGNIPANEGVILKNQGTYTFKTAPTAAAIDNMLEGTTTDAYITPENGTAYVLANGENGVGLFKAKLNQENNTAFLNNANKAYLVIPNGEANPIASYSFNFDWEGTTGIEGVEAEGAQNGKIYDITGREVKAITAPGIYIVNGKKVVK